jgi:predicted ArsR family transcriptional regulator
MSLQLGLDFEAPTVVAPPLARSTDPGTSHAAAASAKELQGQHHRLIVACLEQHGPLGKDGIAARTRLDGVQTCRRLTELARLGLIEWTGKTVSSTAGRAEREWRARG